MKRTVIVWLVFLCLAGAWFNGKIFAGESFNADMASIEEAKLAEANLANMPDDPASPDEEFEDEKAVDADA